MSIFVIIPTYNEIQNTPIIIDGVLAALPAANLVIVDDNSPDGTGDLVEALKKKHGSRLHCIHRTQNKGYGPSCIDGMNYALAKGAEKIIQMDSDGPHDVRVLPKLLEASEKYDLVLGSRYTQGGATPDWPLQRRLLSRGANFYARTILGLSTRDVTTGFRCFRRHVLEALDLNAIRCVGYGFLTEMVYRVAQAGFTIGEYPIHYRDRTLGQSKMGLRIAYEGALTVLKLRFGSSGASGARKEMKKKALGK